MGYLVQGAHQPSFSISGDLLIEHISIRDEFGASIVVHIGGKTVADIWGGHSNESGSQCWVKETFVNVFTITKTITGLAALILIDRGIISPNEKIAAYWPEFAVYGKQDMRIRDIISHTAGVPRWEKPVTLADICDFDQAVTLLAAQALWWTSGTASDYHPFTRGFLIGQVIRKVTGKTLKDFIAEDMAGLLGADFLARD
ncbi:hypothetical protein ACSS6W_007564 [Trichoderma asperelloides]